MIKIALFVVALGLAGVLAYAATRPDTFRVQRTATIQAPPEKILPYINEFDRWTAWSPYEKRDPAMKRTRNGPPAGKGAVYAWEGNKEVGSGRMEILDASSAGVKIQLDFFRPFEAHNIAEFSLEPRGGETQVTWAMHGPATYMTKLIGVFMDMDAMVGKDFEAGLASLKALAEK